jgi:PAS domain-containing protein
MDSQLDNLRKHAMKMLSSNIDNVQVKNKREIDHIFDEIIVQQIELELQNITLIETQQQLTSSQKNYIQLFENAPIGYFILSSSGLINDVNLKGADILGISKQKLINRNLTRYVSPESQLLFSAHRQHSFKNNIFKTCQL